MAASTTTTYLNTVSRAGWVAGTGPGKVSAKVVLGGVTDEANDRVACINFASDTLVLAAGIEVVTPTTNAITGSIGVESADDGSATTLAGELALNGTAGTVLAGAVTTPVLVKDGDYVVLEVSGDAGAAGECYVWLIVADPKHA